MTAAVDVIHIPKNQRPAFERAITVAAEQTKSRHFDRARPQADRIEAPRFLEGRFSKVDHHKWSASELPEDPRVSLLDFVREHLRLYGTKKGSNQGACGACTILVDGERILSCLALAVQYEGRSITTIEGLASEVALHPLRAAFIEHDGFQCGYCTPGQICSAVGMAKEIARGVPSYVTRDLSAEVVPISHEELRERMSGNLCRCGAHNSIVDAIVQTYAEAAE
jgi:xanthine dehydrogenase YagT iron-sulfur-binding subunit